MMTVSISSDILAKMRKAIRKGHRSEFVNRAIRDRLSGSDNDFEMSYRALAIKMSCQKECPPYIKHLIRYELMKEDEKYCEKHMFYLDPDWQGF
jgi:metal-responsive CopG/Arc/MetJ family transcriptional regulator